MKSTKKEIEITLRQKMSQEFNKHLDELKSANAKLRQSLREEQIKRIELQEKVSELEEKVQQYEDWNNRLMSFIDIPEKDRPTAIKDFLASQRANQKFQSYIEGSGLFKMLQFWHGL